MLVLSQFSPLKTWGILEAVSVSHWRPCWIMEQELVLSQLLF